MYTLSFLLNSILVSTLSTPLLESFYFSTSKNYSSSLFKMRAKTPYSTNLKLIVGVLVLVFLLVVVLRSSYSSSNQTPEAQSKKLFDPIEGIEPTSTTTCAPSSSTPTCTKIPPSLVQALLHYTTSNITPQQTLREISVSSQVLQKKSPCNFLVFGLGHDSLMWSALNHNGRTVFLEEDKSWIAQIKERFPTLESYHVVYDTAVHQADSLLGIGKGEDCTLVSDPRFSKCQLSLKGMPSLIYETKWDVIMVDAPTGYKEDAPGRMSAIYTAGLMARNKEDGETDVFVHDVDRVVEDKFSKTFLCDGYMRQQEGRIRHFTIPSHKGSMGKPFCP